MSISAKIEIFSALKSRQSISEPEVLRPQAHSLSNLKENLIAIIKKLNVSEALSRRIYVVFPHSEERKRCEPRPSQSLILAESFAPRAQPR